MTNFEILKGTQDFEPKDQIKLNFIVDLIRKNFESFGFRPFDTPVIEYLDTLTMKYDEDAEIVNEIFKLSDRGERKLGLRYDLTTPLARFVASKPQLKKPFRRYHIAKVFRDGPLKKGRVREFYQFDGDVIGESGIEIEVELLDLFYSTYCELGIKAIIEVNNNKILRGSLLQANCDEKDLSNYILSIDKLKKIGINGVLDEIKSKNLDIKKAKVAIEILDSKTILDLEKKAKDKILKEGIEEIKKLSFFLEKLNVNFKLNFSLSRGLDIYTGNIWEVYDLDNNVASSLGSGGRYNRVIAEYQNLDDEIPAVGISFGLVPIIACLEEMKTLEEKEGLTDLLIVPMNETCVEKAFEIGKKLRKGKNVEIYYGYSMKKAFKYCDYLGVKELVILGEKDIENNKFILKNLKTKEEKEFKL